jgi:hypothetical protein
LAAHPILYLKAKTARRHLMTTILIVVVIFLLLGGGGYWGFRGRR